MATLNTLRTKGGWIVTIVIGISLLAFLIGDLASGNSIFSSGGEKIGSIDGQKISAQEYAQRIEDLSQIQQAMNGGQSLPAEMQDQLRDYAWEQMQGEIVLFPGLEKLGVTVTSDEMFDRMYGNNVSPVLTQSGLFNNADGLYDKSLLQSFESSAQLDPSGQSARLWQYIWDQVRQQALLEKYRALVGGMAYATDAAATRGAERSNVSYNARYVVQPYESVPDSTVTIASSEIRSYYNAHKENYRRTAARNVEYVVFELVPSAADYVAAKALVDEMSAEFAAADDVQQYVAMKSQDPFDSRYYTREQMPAELADYVFNPARDSIYGPMLEGDVYSTIRVSDLRSFPDTIGFRQMQFLPGSEALADSVYTVLRNGGDFDALAAQYSIVPSASVDAGHMTTQGIPIELGEQIYATNDRLVKIDSPSGVGAIILDVYYRGRASQKAQLAALTYYVQPSVATQQAAYHKATAFSSATAGLQDNFNRVAADSAYVKRVANIQAGQSQIAGMTAPRALISWAFNAKPGSISDILEIDNNYVVGTLVSANEEGYIPVAQVASQIAAELRLERKFEQIAARMSGASSLDALAQSLSTQVGNLENITYSTIYVPELGAMDPPLIGAVAGGTPQGQLSKPIRGMSGVYVVEITSTGTSESPASADIERARLEAEAENDLQNRAIQAILAKSKVVDARSRYF